MRRIRRRKVLYGSMLSLIILMSFSLSCLKSSALGTYDASVIVENVPTQGRFFVAQTNASGSTVFAFNTYASGISILGSSASYDWRTTFNCDFTGPDYENSHQIYLLRYDPYFALYTNYVYQFSLNVRIGNSQSMADLDFSKFYLTLGRISSDNSSGESIWFMSSFNKAVASEQLPYLFAPSSWTVSGNFVTIKYNVPIYPATHFPGVPVENDNDGNGDYLVFDFIGFWNQKSFPWHYVVNQNTYRYQTTIFLYNTSSVNLFTPEQWSAHVNEVGFNDLSQKIDSSTGQIVGSINQGVDDILDAGDPVDFSGLENYHDQESAVIDNIISTAPYDPDDASAVFNTSNWSTLLKGATFTNNWYNYVFANNSLIGFLLTLGMAFAVAHQALKGLL